MSTANISRKRVRAKRLHVIAGAGKKKPPASATARQSPPPNPSKKPEASKPSVSSQPSISSHPNVQVPGFSMRPDGLDRVENGEDGKARFKRVSGPFQVEARLATPERTDHSILVSFMDKGERTPVIVPATQFHEHASQTAKKFESLGLAIVPDRAADFVTYLRLAREHAPRGYLVHQTGWFRNGQDLYVLPHITVPALLIDTMERVIYHDADATDSRFKLAGSYAIWQSDVAAKAVGNSRLLLSISRGFAGVLLPVAGETSFGTLLMGVSSRGKTTVEVAGGSVLGGGDPKIGFMRGADSTKTGIEILAAMHNHSTLPLDELSLLNPRELEALIYMLSSGTGRQRGNQDIKARKSLAWNLVFAITGEKTLEEHVRSAGLKVSLKAGVLVRCLEIPADAGSGMGCFENLHGAESPGAFARALIEAALHNYGHALIEFLCRLTELEPAQMKALVQGHRDAFLATLDLKDASPEVQRAARMFSMIAASGEIASAFGITGWATGEANRGVKKCFEDWLAHRGGKHVSHDEHAAIRRIKHIIETEGDSKFWPVGYDNKGMLHPDNFAPDVPGQFVQHRYGYRRRRQNLIEYLVQGETFKTEFCSDLDYQLVANALIERGFMRHQPPGLDINTKVNGKKMRAFCILSTILEADL